VYKTAKNKFKKMKRPVRAFLLTDDDLDLPILGTHNLIDGSRVCVSATAAVSAAGPGTDFAAAGPKQKAASKRELEEMRKAEILRVQAAIEKEHADANREEVEKFSEAQANVRKVREAYSRRTRRRAADAGAAAEHEAQENAWLANRATAIAAAREGELGSVIAARERLPAFKHRAEILDAVFGDASGQICVISGETGCGKTTQVPQFVLEDAIQRGVGGACNIICTQPRRISAIGVAERVASERGERVGESTGYAIKGESRSSPHTRLLFCTVGVLLRRLQSEPTLNSVSHLIVDEVHERDVLTDFLLVMVRDILAARRNLKLILMSATLSASKFAQYFARPGHPIVPTLAIPGFSYPVQDYFLEDVIESTHWKPPVGSTNSRASFHSGGQGGFNGGAGGRLKTKEGYSQTTAQSLSATEQDVIDYDLIRTTLELICSSGGSRERQSVKVGGILVFLPGMMEIRKLCDMLSESRAFSDSKRYAVLGLHSSLDSQAQRAIFRRYPPGVIKIVVSTNIAETSITIDEITHVVDCGRVKEMQ
jgi:HrpA-like RNA helicase